MEVERHVLEACRVEPFNSGAEQDWQRGENPLLPILLRILPLFLNPYLPSQSSLLLSSPLFGVGMILPFQLERLDHSDDIY